MNPRHDYFVQLLGTRPDWPNHMTAEEERIMSEHYHYLLDLTMKNKVALAGPCFSPVFGLIILQTESEEEAIGLMDNEPSVVKGVHTYKLYPMRVSLIREHLSPARYADNPSQRILSKEIEVKADPTQAWEAWTTREGIAAFFAPDANVELSVGGPYEIYFSAVTPRGSEGCRILSYVPERMLSFDWNAPAEFGDLRNKHTQVVLQFVRIESGWTKIIFSQFGWGQGPEWDRLYDYFDKAWDQVLGKLKKRFDSGTLEPGG